MKARGWDVLRRKGLIGAARERQFDLITQHVAATTMFPVCLLTFLDRDSQWVKSSYGIELHKMPRNQAFCNYTVAQGDTFVVPNAAADPRFANMLMVAGPTNVRTYVGHPVVDASGVRLGALCIIDVKPRTVSTALTAQLAGMARIVGELIDQRPGLAA